MLSTPCPYGRMDFRGWEVWWGENQVMSGDECIAQSRVNALTDVEWREGEGGEGCPLRCRRGIRWCRPLSAGDRRLSLKMKAELFWVFLRSRMQFQQLLSVLRPQGPPSLSISVPPLTPLSPGRLQSHTPHCIFPHKFSSIVFHNRTYWQVITRPNFFLKFLEVRNDIFKCHQIVRGYIVYFLSFFVCSTEGKKTEHFHVQTGSHIDIRTRV